NVPDSAETAGLGAGNYSYQATYSGDGNYSGSTGACEPFTVNPATTTTATVVKDNASPANVVDSGSHKAALGTKVHDTATVTSGNNAFTIGGTVSYQLYTGLACATGNESGSASVKTLASGNVPDSAETAGLGAGNYSYQATYSGDGNYSGSTGACEPFTVNPATTTTATIVNDNASPANV